VIIGILALQGNYAMHQSTLERIGIVSIFVKYPHELNQCDGLIIPGGESTSMSKLIDAHQLRESLKNFSLKSPIFGTCAGMILLSSSETSQHMAPLNIMDFTVDRNAWGRQVHSFSHEINLNLKDENIKFRASFIRAPKVQNIGSRIHILSYYKNEPILISDGNHLAASFHPEMGHDSIIHQHYIRMINEQKISHTIKN